MDWRKRSSERLATVTRQNVTTLLQEQEQDLVELTRDLNRASEQPDRKRLSDDFIVTQQAYHMLEVRQELWRQEQEPVKGEEDAEERSFFLSHVLSEFGVLGRNIQEEFLTGGEDCAELALKLFQTLRILPRDDAGRSRE